MQRLPDVHRQEISGHAGGHAFQHAVKRFVGLNEILIVAKISNEYVAGLDGLYMEVGEDPVLQ